MRAITGVATSSKTLDQIRVAELIEFISSPPESADHVLLTGSVSEDAGFGSPIEMLGSIIVHSSGLTESCSAWYVPGEEKVTIQIE